MRGFSSRRRGFTLIELMIVIAILGVLAALAIPNFLRFQLRSKTGEAKTNLAAIRTAEEGYFAEYGVYVDPPAALPAGAPTAGKRTWPLGALAVGFDTLGWSPEGDVYFSYDVDLGGMGNTAFSAAAGGNLDGAGPTSDFAYVHPDSSAPPVAVAPPMVGTGNCAIGGTWNAVSMAADLLNTVGPCESLDAQSEF